MPVSSASDSARGSEVSGPVASIIGLLGDIGLESHDFLSFNLDQGMRFDDFGYTGGKFFPVYRQGLSRGHLCLIGMRIVSELQRCISSFSSPTAEV